MKILVVDDSEFIRQQLKGQLEGHGYQVAEAGSGPEALARLEKEEFSLVTLDIEMPDMNGYQVCSALRVLKEDELDLMPVVFVTSKDSFEERAKGFEAGGADFITKNNLRDSLLSVVDGLLRPEKIYEGLRALIVDDGKVVRKIVTRAFATMGVRTFESNNGQQALDFLRSGVSPVDLIVMDQEMPVLTGRKTCQKIRQDLGMRDVPVIFLVGSTSKHDVVSLFASGATDYIGKPFVKEEFQARVKPHFNTSLLRKKIMLLEERAGREEEDALRA